MPAATPRDPHQLDPHRLAARAEYTPTQDVETREVVALFSEPHAMEAGVEALLVNGFDHGDLSVLASEKVLREKLGHRLDDTLTAADDPEVPRRAWVEPESRMEGRGALASVLGYFGAVGALGLTFATGGGAAVAIGAALVGAGAGAGLGVGLGRLFDQRLAREFEHQVERGGILVWVRCHNDECERKAVEILNGHGAHHVHAHDHRPS